MMNQAQAQQPEREWALEPRQEHDRGQEKCNLPALAEYQGIEQANEQAPGLAVESVVEYAAPAAHELAERGIHPAGDEITHQRRANRQAQRLDLLRQADVFDESVANRFVTACRLIGRSFDQN